MLSITKLQNLKAIHNTKDKALEIFKVVINHKTTKFESNSQPPHSLHWPGYVVINHKTTKFESNSQLNEVISQLVNCCYQSQNYKIWKQFTTLLRFVLAAVRLLSITKLQNLKAIHNFSINSTLWGEVVINHKTTKFESNSQHFLMNKEASKRCYQSQNYKIWKQFTTGFHSIWVRKLLLSITKLQNLKAIHNH